MISRLYNVIPCWLLFVMNIQKWHESFFFFVNLDETHCSQTAGQNPICKMCLISQVYHKNFPFSDMSSASAEQITRLSLNQRIWAGFSTFQL